MTSNRHPPLLNIWTACLYFNCRKNDWKLPYRPHRGDMPWAFVSHGCQTNAHWK